MNLEAHLRALLANQSEHPVYPPIELCGVHGLDADILIAGAVQTVPMEEVAELRLQRERRIKREKEDRFRYTCEPEMWRLTDLAVARMRLANPGEPLELLCTGGIRSGKTDFVTSRVVRHFFYTPEAWVWGLHETEQSSKTIQQKRVMAFFPPELNPDTGKMRKDKHTKFNYSDGGGFTGNMFTLTWQCQDERANKFTGGGMFDFKFYQSKDSSLQGSELTCATSDELVPVATVNTVRERLLSRSADTRKPAFLERLREAIRLLEAGEELPGPLQAVIYHGVHLISFTPKEGYSPTVADFLDGARTILEVPAELLPPKFDPATGKNGPQMVPRFKQPKKPSRLVAYFHTYDNAFKGNWEGMKKTVAGNTEGYIRVIAYGDVSKGWAVQYPKFRDTVHLCKREAVPREGSWYHVVDPAGDRSWFQIWALVDRFNRVFIVRESPQEGDFIPDVGDPGPWAVTSETGKRNGDPGPAQDGHGWGFLRHKKEIERIEAEIGHWWNQSTKKPIEVRVRKMDSRLGAAPSTTHGGYASIMDSMEEIGMLFEAASGTRLVDGDAAIQDALDFDESQPLSLLNSPKLFICETCTNLIFMFQNYGPPAKPKDEACKDPRDVVAYLLLDQPCYQEPDVMTTDDEQGGSY